MSEKLVGTPKHRREDPDLVRGDATYTDDVQVPEAAHAALLRSRHAHASIESIDASEAAAAEGVVEVITGEDIEQSDAPGVIQVPPIMPNAVPTPFPVLATDVVRYVGEAIAVVVAEDRYVAHDALDLIDVEYERREAVVDVREALEEDAPTLHEEAPDNLAFDWPFGDEEALDEAFAEADATASVELQNQRLIGDPMEPRSVLAEVEDDGLKVTMSTQVPHMEVDHLAGTLGLDEEDVHVVSPDVGGGFGIKGGEYPEEVVVSWCALHLDRPVKWTETRSEAHQADYQSRDWYLDGELALDDDGTITAMRVDCANTVGGYFAFGPTLAGNFQPLLSGQYEIDEIGGRIVGSYTNTTPTASYRGAGRPEVMYLVERLIDAGARELDMDPAEFRRRNLVPSDAFPYESAVGAVYDSGDYERALDLALEHVDYDALRERQAELREEGRYLGIGISSIIENSANQPGMGEFGRVRFGRDGKLTAYLGTHDHGQGHETSFAQILSDELGVEYDDIEIEEGDTQHLPGGVGTFGSRSMSLGGAAMVEAAERVKEEAREVAVDELEAAPEDIEFADGEFHVTGAPERSIHITEIARRAADREGDLDATEEYDPPNFGWPFGTHIAVVEVDPESGEVDFERYVAVDDCGTIINPMIVDGQIHGGVAQGIGQALYEGAEYDDNGQLVTGSLQDYALPRASHIPELETDETETPSPHNPLGVKGTGEAGTTAATPAVMNAIVDALEPFGVEDVEMPARPEAVWRAIEESDGSA